MANKARGEVTIPLGGKDRRLRFDFGTIARIQDEAGDPSVERLFTSRLLDARTLLIILTHGIRTGEQNPMVEQRDFEKIEEIDYRLVIRRLKEAYFAFAGIDENEEKRAASAGGAEGKEAAA